MNNEQAKEWLEKIKKHYHNAQIVEAIDKGIEALELKETLELKSGLPKIVREIEGVLYGVEKVRDTLLELARSPMVDIDWNGEKSDL